MLCVHILDYCFVLSNDFHKIMQKVQGFGFGIRTSLCHFFLAHNKIYIEEWQRYDKKNIVNTPKNNITLKRGEKMQSTKCAYTTECKTGKQVSLSCT